MRVVTGDEGDGFVPTGARFIIRIDHVDEVETRTIVFLLQFE